MGKALCVCVIIIHRHSRKNGGILCVINIYKSKHNEMNVYYAGAPLGPGHQMFFSPPPLFPSCYAELSQCPWVVEQIAYYVVRFTCCLSCSVTSCSSLVLLTEGEWEGTDQIRFWRSVFWHYHLPNMVA